MTFVTYTLLQSYARDFLWVVGIFFLVYLIGYSTFLFLSVSVGSSVLYRRKRETRFKSVLSVNSFIPVSILVPAYNERLTIVSSIRSLLELDYPLYEIIIIDDGSNDGTSQAVLDEFGLNPLDVPVRMQIPCQATEQIWIGKQGNIPITLVRKVNGGKADALNMGINICKFPYFICMDADSVLQHDSLREITAPILEDKNVVAVGGLVRISNGISFRNGEVSSYSLPKRIIPAMQVLEYDRSFLSARILLDQFNGNLIISGAFGLFSKKTAIACGGYDAGTVGEDMELVTNMHAYCRSNDIDYSIRYNPNAICWSQAPDTLHDLRKQRKRWHRGLMECMFKHRSLFANPRYGVVSTISYTYFVIYELLSPFIELFGLLTMAFAVVLNLINVPYMITFFLVYAAFGAILSLTAFFSRVQTRDLTLSASDTARALLLALIEVTVLRFIMALTRMGAVLTYRKNKGKWERADRFAIDAK